MSDLLPLTPLDHRLNRIQIIKLKLVAVRNGNGQIGIAIVLWQKTHKNKARGNNKIDESHNTGKVVDFMGGKTFCGQVRFRLGKLFQETFIGGR